MSEQSEVNEALRRVSDRLNAAQAAAFHTTTVVTADLLLVMRFTATLARMHPKHIVPAATVAEQEVPRA